MTDAEQQAQVRRSVAAIADRVAERAAKKAVHDTLLALGIDVSDPIEAQKQFAMLRRLADPRTMKNLDWLESLHTASERVADTSWKTIIRLLIGAGFGLVALVTREYWFNHIWK
jgi:hypothetical protein